MKSLIEKGDYFLLSVEDEKIPVVVVEPDVEGYVFFREVNSVEEKAVPVDLFLQAATWIPVYEAPQDEEFRFSFDKPPSITIH